MEPQGKIKKEFSFLLPDRKPRPDFYIDPLFANEVKLHIVKNASAKLSPPLILGIQGPKGEGKSQQVREVCSRLGVLILFISGSAISGGQEKEPLNIIRDAYVEASNQWMTRKMPVLIVIDDIDTSAAAMHSNRIYSVNSQLVSGALMHLADDPYNVGDRVTMRIPIVMTGNNFASLYGPLTRHGRMRFFDWVPSEAQKLSIVRGIFTSMLPPYELNYIDEFTRLYLKEPVAFFAELKNDVLDTVILRMLQESEDLEMRELNELIDRTELKTTLADLHEAAARKKGLFARNFLTEEDMPGQVPEELVGAGHMVYNSNGVQP
jgi:hypothetical protein